MTAKPKRYRNSKGEVFTPNFRWPPQEVAEMSDLDLRILLTSAALLFLLVVILSGLGSVLAENVWNALCPGIE